MYEPRASENRRSSIDLTNIHLTELWLCAVFYIHQNLHPAQAIPKPMPPTPPRAVPETNNNVSGVNCRVTDLQ